MIPTYVSPSGELKRDTPVAVLDAGGTNLRPVSFDGKDFQALGGAADEAGDGAAVGRLLPQLQAEGGTGPVNDHRGFHHDFPDFFIRHIPLRNHRAGNGNRRLFRGSFLHGEGEGVIKVRILFRIQVNGVFAGSDFLIVGSGSVPAEDVPVRIFHGDAFGIDFVTGPVQDIHGNNAIRRHPAFHKPVLSPVEVQGFGGGERESQRGGVTPDTEGGGGGEIPAVRGEKLRNHPVRSAHQQFPAGTAPVPGQDGFPVGQALLPVQPGIIQAVVQGQEHFARGRGLDCDFTVRISLHFLRKGKGKTAFFCRSGSGQQAGKQEKGHQTAQPGAEGPPVHTIIPFTVYCGSIISAYGPASTAAKKNGTHIDAKRGSVIKYRMKSLDGG